jgi:alpha-tubulin suppressor-like RCC1 family protein
MDMDEYVNIIKYEKIKGVDILEGDELFFLNVMGLKDDQYKKLKYEINKVKNVTSRKSTLWGWGSNKYGQLGHISYNKYYIKHPTVINLPELKDEDDYVVNIHCGKTYSLLLTKFGEVYITGNYLVKEKAANLIQSTTVNQNVKGDKKHKTPMKSKVVIQGPVQHRWVNITKEVCFNSVCDKNTSK